MLSARARTHTHTHPCVHAHVQVSFDPASNSDLDAAHVSVTVGDTSHRFELGGPASARDELASSFPPMPFLTVCPNLLFEYVAKPSPLRTAPGMAAEADNAAAACGARGAAAAESGATTNGWGATICWVSVARGGLAAAGGQWLGEMLCLSSCVTADVISSLFLSCSPAAAAGRGGEAASQPTSVEDWLACDLLRRGRLGPSVSQDPAMGTTVGGLMDVEEAVRVLKWLPGRPHPLRAHALLDQSEAFVAAAMLHHLGLLSYVRTTVLMSADVADAVVVGDDMRVVLGKVAEAAGKLRRRLMLERDSIVAAADDLGNQSANTFTVSDGAREGAAGGAALTDGRAAAAGAGGVHGDVYEGLCEPVIRRASLLLEFVSALSPSDAGVLLSRSSSGKSACCPELISEESDGKFEASPTSRSASGETAEGEGGAGMESWSQRPLTRWQQAVWRVMAGNHSSRGWDAVMPLLILHRACWRLRRARQAGRARLLDLASRFVTCNVSVSGVEAAVAQRAARARDLGVGLAQTEAMLSPTRARAVRAEVLHLHCLCV